MLLVLEYRRVQGVRNGTMVRVYVLECTCSSSRTECTYVHVYRNATRVHSVLRRCQVRERKSTEFVEFTQEGMQSCHSSEFPFTPAVPVVLVLALSRVLKYTRMLAYVMRVYCNT